MAKTIYIYCLWVAGSYKGQGIAKTLLEYAINDSKENPQVVFVHWFLKRRNLLSEAAKESNIKINFIKLDTLEKAKNAPCVFNNWANFYKGEFISNTILNGNSLKKLLDQ